jgi:hypothetical protein
MRILRLLCLAVIPLSVVEAEDKVDFARVPLPAGLVAADTKAVGPYSEDGT